MEWKEFEIEEVARLCGIQMKNDGMGAREIKALCPFCSDKHYHLYLNTEKNQWNCFRCGAKGNDVSLYARMNCITNREAVNELSERIGNTMPKKIKQAISTPMKSLVDRHNVYYDMLKLLKLNNNHHKALLKRGLREDNIRQFMYKSLPETEYERRRIINALSVKYDLRGVPGFYRKYGEWHMYSSDCGGFLIPVCNKDGYIQGMQIRFDSDKKRYRWFSTNEYPEGTGVSSWVHIVGDTSSDSAYLTEGALKAAKKYAYSRDGHAGHEERRRNDRYSYHHCPRRRHDKAALQGGYFLQGDSKHRRDRQRDAHDRADPALSGRMRRAPGHVLARAVERPGAQRHDPVPA